MPCACACKQYACLTRKVYNKGNYTDLLELNCEKRENCKGFLFIFASLR